MNELTPQLAVRNRDILIAFRRVNNQLLSLLRSLTHDEWENKTVHVDRNVKDLVAHLVDGSMRRLAAQRDGWQPAVAPMRGFREVVAFIQDLNRTWIDAAKRLSPALLIDLAARYDDEVLHMLENLDPHAPALYPVAWAGDATSPQWFDTAREYTEKWHHQQQIRDATGRPPLYESSLFEPVIETFVRGLPHAWRDLKPPVGSKVTLSVTGALDRTWHWKCMSEGWHAEDGVLPDDPLARLEIDAGQAWRLWTRGLDVKSATAALKVYGDGAYAQVARSFTATMA